MTKSWKRCAVDVLPSEFRVVDGELYLFMDSEDADCENSNYAEYKLTVEDGKIVFWEEEVLRVYAYVLTILEPTIIKTHKGEVKSYSHQKWVGEYINEKEAEKAGKAKTKGTDAVFTIKKSIRVFTRDLVKYQDFERVTLG